MTFQSPTPLPTPTHVPHPPSSPPHHPTHGRERSLFHQTDIETVSTAQLLMQRAWAFLCTVMPYWSETETETVVPFAKTV